MLQMLRTAADRSPRQQLAVALAVLFFGNLAQAQQAIVSLPSADVTPPREVFLMQESQVRPWAPDPYWNTTHFFAYGLGAHTELAATLFNVGVPGTGRPTMGYGFKSSVPVLPWTGRDLKVTFGAMALVAPALREVGHWFYTHLSGRLPALETRLSLGVSQGSSTLFYKEVTSMMAAAEQPLIGEELTLVAEWFSGQHDLANFIYGLAYHPNHHWIFVLGHKIPTSGPEFGTNKMGIIAEVGVFF